MSIKRTLFYSKYPPNCIKERFRTIGGYNNVKETLSLYCSLLEQTELLKEWNVDVQGKILLHGPPGTGKTSMVKALAYEKNLPLVIIRTVQIRSKYIAEAGQNLEKLAEDLKENHQTSIIFFDEFDSIAMDRGKKDLNSEDQKVVNAILTAFDSLSLAEDQLLVIAATNYEQILDDAVWRRFDEIIFMDLPNFEQRRNILKIFSRKIPKSCLRIDDFGKLARITEDWSGSDLKRLINHAVIIYLGENEKKSSMDLEFFEEAINNGIVSPTTLKHYKTFSQIRKDRLESDVSPLREASGNEEIVKDLKKKLPWVK